MRDAIPIDARERNAVAIRPLHDNVTVVVEPPTLGILGASGLIELPPWETGHVLRGGPGRKTRDGRLIPPGYDPHERPHGWQQGDRVCFRRGHGTTVGEIGGKRVVLLRNEQVEKALLPEGELRIRDGKTRSE